MVQWNHACYGIFKCMGLNPGLGPRVGMASTRGNDSQTAELSVGRYPLAHELL